MGKFSSRFPRSRKPGQPGLSYEHIEGKSGEERFGNRARPVDRAHMKRLYGWRRLTRITNDELE